MSYGMLKQTLAHGDQEKTAIRFSSPGSTCILCDMQPETPYLHDFSKFRPTFHRFESTHLDIIPPSTAKNNSLSPSTPSDHLHSSSNILRDRKRPCSRKPSHPSSRSSRSPRQLHLPNSPFQPHSTTSPPRSPPPTTRILTPWRNATSAASDSPTAPTSPSMSGTASTRSTTALGWGISESLLHVPYGRRNHPLTGVLRAKCAQYSLLPSRRRHILFGDAVSRASLPVLYCGFVQRRTMTDACNAEGSATAMPSTQRFTTTARTLGISARTTSWRIWRVTCALKRMMSRWLEVS